MIPPRRRILAILVVAAPLMLVWHVELIYPVTLSTAGPISSGYLDLDERGASMLYHTLLYATLAVTWAAAYALLDPRYTRHG